MDLTAEEQEVRAPHQLPYPQGLAHGRGVPITSNFENQQGLYWKEMKGNGKLRQLLKVSHTNSHFELQCGGSTLRRPGSYGEELIY